MRRNSILSTAALRCCRGVDFVVGLTDSASLVLGLTGGVDRLQRTLKENLSAETFKRDL